MPSKKQLEKMQLVNMPRAEREKFFKTYQQNRQNPNKWNPQYNAELVNALSAARQREKQNRGLMAPRTTAYLHSYPTEMVQTFGTVYKQMYPHSKQNVFKIGQKILDNPSQFPQVYHAIFETPYQYGGFTPAVKKNIEDQLVSKLGYGYQQKPTPKERKGITREVERVKQNRPKIIDSVLPKSKTQIQTPPIQTPPVEKKRGRKPKIQEPTITESKTPTINEPKQNVSFKKAIEQTPPKRQVGRPKKQDGKEPDKFKTIEPIIDAPLVKPQTDSKSLKQITKSTERFKEKAPQELLSKTDKAYTPLKLTGTSPIHASNSAEKWRNETVTFNADMRDRGVKNKDLFYQMVNDPAVRKAVQKGKIPGVHIDRDVIFAESKEAIESVGSPNIIYEGNQLSWWTDFNKETKRFDLPYHPAHMKWKSAGVEMRNPDTQEIITRLSKSTAKPVYLGVGIVDDKGARKKYQLLYEKRDVIYDPYTGLPKQYGEWELFAKDKDYALTKKEKEKEFQKRLDKLGIDIPDTDEPDIDLSDTFNPDVPDIPEPLPAVELPNLTTEPIELTEEEAKEILEELKPEEEEIPNIPVPDIPEPPPAVEPPEFEPIEDLPQLEDVFVPEVEEEEVMGQITEPNDPDQELLREITKRVNKGRVATENWFRCCRIEFGQNVADFPMLIDLANRVANMDPRLLFKPRTEIDLWYHKWGASRAPDLIKNLENVSGLKKNENMTEQENRGVDRIMRYYAKRMVVRLREQLEMEGLSGSDLAYEIEKRMLEMGYRPKDFRE